MLFKLRARFVFRYEGEWMNWHLITAAQAKEIVELNKKKQKVASLEEYAADIVIEEKTEFENVVGQDSLTRFDSPKRNKKRRNNRNRKSKQNQNKVKAEGQQQNPNQKKSNNRKPKRKPNPRKPQNNSNKPNESK